MALNLGALSNIRQIADPAARAHSLATLRAMGQEETLRGQEQQLNTLKLESAKTANQEWAEVKSIFDKHAGDKEGAISEVLQRPWRNKEITDTYTNEAKRMRDEAVSNAALSQGQPAPEVQAAAPQTTTAPIQTSLTDPTQMSTPQVSAPATQQVPTPLKQVQVPFGGPKIQPRSAQQVFNDLIRTKQAESDIARDAKIAEAKATRDAKSDVKLDETYRNGHRILRMQRPDNSQYEVDAGIAQAAPKQPTPGVDVPYSPEVQAQRLQAARERAAANASNPDDAKIIAQAVIDGKEPPDLTSFYRQKSAIVAELAKQGYDRAAAERDWKAVQKHLSTLNGAQQERLRQAVSFTSDSLDNIDALYQEWLKVGPASGFKILNKAALHAAKQLPGKPGEVAQNLEAQINDLVSELGTVYKGGNASTDETLRLAAENLKADWNEQTFKRATEQIRKNLQIRKNSIANSQAAGVNPLSPYNPTPATPPAAPAAPTSGFRIIP